MLSGAATHYVKSHRFTDLLSALCEGEPVNAVLAGFMEQDGKGEVMPRRRTIDRVFSQSSVEAVLAALDLEVRTASDQAKWSAELAQIIGSKSPISLKLSFAQMRYGRHHSFEDCMRTEFRIVSRIVYGHDMAEGVRAVIVDKDNNPRWNPKDLEAVSDTMIERYFEPLAGAELELS